MATTILKKPHYMVAAKRLGIDTDIVKQYATDLGFYFRKIGGLNAGKFLQTVRTNAKTLGWHKEGEALISPDGVFSLHTECYYSTNPKQNRYILNILKNNNEATKPTRKAK